MHFWSHLVDVFLNNKVLRSLLKNCVLVSLTLFFFFVVVVFFFFLMGTAEAAPATQKKNRTSNPDLSYPNLSQPYTTRVGEGGEGGSPHPTRPPPFPLPLTITLTQADKGAQHIFVSTNLNLNRTPCPWCLTIF